MISKKVSFWISIEATPARISLGITTVLTISSMRNGAAMSLPKVSYIKVYIPNKRQNLNSIKAIDIWLSFCMVLVFAAVLEYAIANYLHRQSDGLLARNSQRFNQAKISSMCHDMLNRYDSYGMNHTI